MTYLPGTAYFNVVHSDDAITASSGYIMHLLNTTLLVCYKYYINIGNAVDFEKELNMLLEKEGYVQLTISKVLITGAAGSGKTCTKCLLYKLPPPPPKERHSTELFEQMKRAQYSREIKHDIAIADDYDWVVIESDSDQLYVMLAVTIESKEYECDDTDSTCLLYTSPSPRDATLSRMPSSA